ncbi:MAG: peptide-methionine (R)-S-oxide reductase MsrB [Patescibacteria group bacterium]
MIKSVSIALGIFSLGVLALWQYGFFTKGAVTESLSDLAVATETALFAGGCFWSVEYDLEKVAGVIKAETGYAGGTTENPTYENYVEGGHREVVEVTYDPKRVSYDNLAEYLIKHTDPTDAGGSFYDRGAEYASAIYYETDEEKKIAEEILAEIDGKKIYPKPIVMLVIARPKFWPAEDHHQDYAQKNPISYVAYRNASGRSVFIEKYWGENKDVFFTQGVTMDTRPETEKAQWESYKKPQDADLRKMLTPLQYEVTQENGTERPFSGGYDANKAEGIYVDVLSGEPLYSSEDKFDSGTGWPSFVRPITPQAVSFVEDTLLFSSRTEVRSRYADSHLGHVFDDGPSDRGGKRYCMNAAALRFVPKESMEKEGYGEYLGAF